MSFKHDMAVRNAIPRREGNGEIYDTWPPLDRGDSRSGLSLFTLTKFNSRRDVASLLSYINVQFVLLISSLNLLILASLYILYVFTTMLLISGGFTLVLNEENIGKWSLI